MTIQKRKGVAMEREIRNLQKAVYELKDAIKALTATVPSNGSNGHRRRRLETLPGLPHPSGEQEVVVCTDTNCSVVHSHATICDHTMARYRSEYTWG